MVAFHNLPPELFFISKGILNPRDLFKDINIFDDMWAKRCMAGDLFCF